MIQIRDETGDSLTLEVRGRLTEEDYRDLVPRLDREIERREKLRLLILLRDFEGWTPAALLEELRFDLRHRKDFDRVAVVGERAWEELGTKISAPFFSGSVRFFDKEESARAWLG